MKPTSYPLSAIAPIARTLTIRLLTGAALCAGMSGCVVVPVAQPAVPHAATAQTAAQTAAPQRSANRAAPAAAAPAQTPIVILNNRGGNVVQMMAYRADLAASGRPVEIRGACDSACTMLTTLPNACLAPDATIGFHAPRLPGTQVIPPIVDQLMATTYRNGIRARWFNEWRHSLSIKSITAREYVKLDPMTRLCPR